MADQEQPKFLTKGCGWELLIFLLGAISAVGILWLWRHYCG